MRDKGGSGGTVGVAGIVVFLADLSKTLKCVYGIREPAGRCVESRDPRCVGEGHNVITYESPDYSCRVIIQC